MLLVDLFADEVHAHGRADGRDVEGAEGGDDRLQRGEDLLARDVDLGVFAAYVVGDLLRVFEVDRVLIHADGEGADGLLPRRRVPMEQTRELSSPPERRKPSGASASSRFLTARDELFADVSAHLVQPVRAVLRRGGNVLVAVELPLVIIVPRAGRA